MNSTIKSHKPETVQNNNQSRSKPIRPLNINESIVTERKTKMTERKIVFKNFRNIGIDISEKLIINTTNSDFHGNLVLLIGFNNSGKSNVLDGIFAFKNGITNRDKPDFKHDELETSIELHLKNNENVHKVVVLSGSKKAFSHSKEIAAETQVKITQKFRQYLEQAGHSTIADKINSKRKLTEQEVQTIKNLLTSSRWNSYYDGYSQEVKNNFLDEFTEYLKTSKKNIDVLINEKTEGQTIIPLLPTISRYQETFISQKEMEVQSSEIAKSNFFTRILDIIGIELSEIKSCYEQFETNRVRAVLKNFQEKLNKQKTTLEEQFNKIYTFDNKKYKFEFAIDSDRLFFSITLNNGTPLDLDRQSTGFKWFFNFYINVLADKKLSKGDIVIMDEPATNLHPSGVIELRSFLKEYAKKSGITFIISTHSPFFIDIDYLDELRLIHRADEKATINNKFSVLKDDTRDTLFSVLNLLTVGRHVLINPENILIFVEGITDYNYLVAFKKFFKKDNIFFLPVNGVKDNDLIEKLSSISKNPIILVDGDWAGKRVLKQNEQASQKADIICLADINPNFNNIEDLFDGGDKIIVSDKSYNHSCDFKNNFSSQVEKLSSKTKNNFEILFQKLENCYLKQNEKNRA